jgi:RasGEF domain
MINRSNSIPYWVATEIVQRDNLEKRVAVLRKFIYIADHCRALCNFNGLMEILSGLNMTAVSLFVAFNTKLI